MDWLVLLGVAVGGILAGLLVVWSRDTEGARSLLRIGLALPSVGALAFGVLVLGHDLFGGVTQLAALALWTATGLVFGAATLLLDRVPWHRMSTRSYLVAMGGLGLAALIGLAVTTSMLVTAQGLGSGTQTYEATVEPEANGTVHVTVPLPEADSIGGERALDRLVDELAREGAGTQAAHGDRPPGLILGVEERVHLSSEIEVYGSKDARKVFEDYRFRSLNATARSEDPARVDVTVGMNADDGPTRACFLENVLLEGTLETLGSDETTSQPLSPADLEAEALQEGPWPIQCEQ